MSDIHSCPSASGGKNSLTDFILPTISTTLVVCFGLFFYSLGSIKPQRKCFETFLLKLKHNKG